VQLDGISWIFLSVDHSMPTPCEKPWRSARVSSPP
jgi:hypothetical protein